MATILETDETGALVLPARVLGGERPHARYVLETQGETLVLRREDEAVGGPSPVQMQSREQFVREWQDLAEQVSRAGRGPKSALEELTDMRNARG